MAENSNDIGAFFAGFMIGGLVGAAVALLMAPYSGEDTRTLIKDKSIELKDKAVVTGHDARMRAEKALEDARVHADAAIMDLRARTDELAQLTKERAAELQQRVVTLTGMTVEEAESAAEEAADAAVA